LLAVAIARHGERDGGVPAPAGLEHRRVEECLNQDVFRRRRVQVAEDVCERKRVLRAKREQETVLGGGGLQLEVELAAETLAQREAPRLVDAAAERRVQHELHTARFVEEPFEHDGVLRRQYPQYAAAFTEIVDCLLRAGERHAGFTAE